MQHSSLIAFLDGILSPREFAEEIDSEVNECTVALKSTRIGHIYVTDGPTTILTRERTRRLLGAVSDGALSSEAASYVADCIIMGHTLDADDDDVILSAIHFLADGDQWPLS